MEIENDTIKDILITGDFWMLPDSAVSALETTLRGTKLEQTILEECITGFYEDQKIQAPGTTPKDFITAILQSHESNK